MQVTKIWLFNTNKRRDYLIMRNKAFTKKNLTSAHSLNREPWVLFWKYFYQEKWAFPRFILVSFKNVPFSAKFAVHSVKTRMASYKHCLVILIPVHNLDNWKKVKREFLILLNFVCDEMIDESSQRSVLNVCEHSDSSQKVIVIVRGKAGVS